MSPFISTLDLFRCRYYCTTHETSGNEAYWLKMEPILGAGVLNQGLLQHNSN
jgi:hypothetical protein